MDSITSVGNKSAIINTYSFNYLDDEFSDLKTFELINDMKSNYDRKLYSSKFDQSSFSFLKFEDKKTEQTLAREDLNQNNSFYKIKEEQKKESVNNLNPDATKSIVVKPTFLSNESYLNENLNRSKSLFESNIINNVPTNSINSFVGSSLFPQNTQTNNLVTTQIKSEEKQNTQLQDNKFPNIYSTQQLNQNYNISKEPDLPVAKQELENKEAIKAEIIKIESGKENIPKLSAIQKLRLSSDNYFTLRNKISLISEDKNKRIISDKIATEVNVIINQLSQMDDINNNASRISNLLSELKKSNQLELYLFTIDMLIKRLIFKSEKYKSEHKRNYLIFGKFIFELNKLVGGNLICDFFMQLIVYKCPYIAFKEINKADYPDDKTYKKRLGFSNESESMTDFFSNIESYTYLFFAFLFHSLRFYSSNPNHPNYKHYLSNLLLYLEDFIHFFENCESKEIKYPHVVIFKVFLNCLGNEILKHVPNITEKLIKIAMKIVKHMEEQKKKPGVTSEIKSLITDNLHFIKTYAKEVKERKITDMHK